jgi:arginyl-tRNA synthetase
MFAELAVEARNILRKSFGLEASVVWECPRDGAFGDATTSAPLQLAGTLKKKPREIADILAAGLRGLRSVERSEVAGSGYVNVWLTTEALLRELGETKEAQTPQPTRKEENPIIVEYSSPNIAKPLGIHHILSTVIGQAIVNLYRHTGHNVIGWSFPGDWGTQFGKLAVAFKKWGGKNPVADHSLDELLELYVRFHRAAEIEPSLEEEARAVFSKLEDGDPELRAFWQDVVAISQKALEKLYGRLQVRFDVQTGESFYEDKMAPILEEGQKKGVFVEGEGGALIVQFPEERGIPPLMLRKSDGSTLYATRDLAMIRYRIDNYHPQAMEYVVDVAQTLHFQQLFMTVELLGWEAPRLEHVVFGRMRFADKKMSTRAGDVLKLEDVLDESVRRADQVIAEHGDTIQTDDRAELAETMGIGAVVYGILSQNRKMDMVFDWDKVLTFEGNSAPYVQYAYARARSVLRKANVDGELSLPKNVEQLQEHDRALAKTLLSFGGVLADARDSHMPHKLANFLYQLSQDFNAFYNAEPILKAEEPIRSLRLALTALTATVLKRGAGILTLRVPERM